MSIYNPASKEAIELLNEVMASYEEHRQLIDEKVTIDFLFAYGKEKADGAMGDALKLRGIKCLGLIKKTDIKARTLGHADCLLLVDGEWWKTAPDAERRALLDHELYHIDLKRDEHLAAERDDMQRPKIIMRKHDYELGEFTLIAKRHGAASQECKLMARIREEAGQYYWPDLQCGPASDSDVELVRKLDDAGGKGATLTADLAAPLKRLTQTVDGGGVTSMTISAGEHSVTIDREGAKKIKESCNTVLAKDKKGKGHK